MFVFVIKEKRKEKNITLYRLMKLTGLSYSYLSELENNKVYNPSLATMYKIAHALNVKIDDLVYGELDIETLREEMYTRIDKFRNKFQRNNGNKSNNRFISKYKDEKKRVTISH